VLSDTNSTLAAAIVGGVIGIAASIVSVLFGESRKRKESKIRSWNDFLAEVRQNRQHQLTSTYISLEDSAFKRFRAGGFLNDLDTAVQGDLIGLYSRIHEKNELISTWRTSGIQIGSRLVITDGSNKNPTPFENVLAEVTVQISNNINTILPLLERSYYDVVHSTE
jgi:hypothetical protein